MTSHPTVYEKINVEGNALFDSRLGFCSMEAILRVDSAAMGDISPSYLILNPSRHSYPYAFSGASPIYRRK